MEKHAADSPVNAKLVGDDQTHWKGTLLGPVCALFELRYQCMYAFIPIACRRAPRTKEASSLWTSSSQLTTRSPLQRWVARRLVLLSRFECAELDSATDAIRHESLASKRLERQWGHLLGYFEGQLEPGAHDPDRYILHPRNSSPVADTAAGAALLSLQALLSTPEPGASPCGTHCCRCTGDNVTADSQTIRKMLKLRGSIWTNARNSRRPPSSGQRAMQAPPEVMMRRFVSHWLH